MRKGFLRKRGEFLKTYKGYAVRLPLIVVYARSNGLEQVRFGCTTPRAAGNAVIRNRLRRWAKEIYRRAKLPDGLALDLHVFVGTKAKPKGWDYKEVKFDEFRRQVEEGLSRVFKHFKADLPRNH